MKTIKFKGRIYLVSSPRLCHGCLRHTCDAWTTIVKRDVDGHKRAYPRHRVIGQLTLHDLAKIYMDGFGEND